ncbi:hypothetical protein H9P43_006068 [Blastocladiella emersonii ATCC 22665]|nr:hypothetical protein H9P43_006068 [Blastocladiella emersonii ATCC 22665]
MKQKKKTNGKRAAKGASTTQVSKAAAVEASLTSATLALNDTADPYYAFGRSYERDIFFLYNPRTFRRIDALVFQCGDLRDVAYTFNEAKRKYGRGADLTFVLSDMHPEVLARNLLVLHGIAQCDPDDLYPHVAHIGQLYYSHLLEPKTRDFWFAHMRSCLTADWTRENAKSRVLDDDTLRAAFGPGSDRRRDPAQMVPIASWEDHPITAPFLCRLAFIAGHPLKVMDKLIAHGQLYHPPQPNYQYQQRLQVEQNLLRFNIIETGNLMDTVGLLNLIVHASPLLAGPHSTGALLPKLLANAFASGRLAWTNVSALVSAPWPDMRELWAAIESCPRLPSRTAEIFAHALLRGFPLHVSNLLNDKHLYRVEGTLDRTHLAAASAINPLSAMVLEITVESTVHQFRSLLVTPTGDGDQQLLRVAAYVPRFIRRQVDVILSRALAPVTHKFAHLPPLMLEGFELILNPDEVIYAAVLVLHRLSVIPQSDPSRAHTPVLEMSYMPNPNLTKGGTLVPPVNPAGLAFMSKIAPNFGNRPPGTWNETGAFETKFWDRVQPFLYRCYLMPLFPAHGTQYRVAIPPPRDVTSPAAEADGDSSDDEDEDDRIVET